MVTKLVFRLERDDCPGGRTADYKIVRLNAELVSIVNDERRGCEHVLDADFDGMADSLYHLHAFHADTFKAQPVINGKYRISIVIQELDPLLIMCLVPLSSHESATESENDGGLFLAVDFTYTAICRFVEIQVEGRVALHEKMGGSRGRHFHALGFPFVARLQ